MGCFAVEPCCCKSWLNSWCVYSVFGKKTADNQEKQDEKVFIKFSRNMNLREILKVNLTHFSKVKRRKKQNNKSKNNCGLKFDLRALREPKNNQHQLLKFFVEMITKSIGRMNHNEKNNPKISLDIPKRNSK
jgi:hypothetical protein